MKKFPLIIFLALALAGCATPPPAHVVSVDQVRVMESRPIGGKFVAIFPQTFSSLDAEAVNSAIDETKKKSAERGANIIVCDGRFVDEFYTIGFHKYMFEIVAYWVPDPAKAVPVPALETLPNPLDQ